MDIAKEEAVGLGSHISGSCNLMVLTVLFFFSVRFYWGEFSSVFRVPHSVWVLSAGPDDPFITCLVRLTTVCMIQCCKGTGADDDRFFLSSFPGILQLNLRTCVFIPFPCYPGFLQ